MILVSNLDGYIAIFDWSWKCQKSSNAVRVRKSNNSSAELEWKCLGKIKIEGDLFFPWE